MGQIGLSIPCVLSFIKKHHHEAAGLQKLMIHLCQAVSSLQTIFKVLLFSNRFVKVSASSVLRGLSHLSRAPSQALIVSQCAATEPTAPRAWCPVWNAPRTPSLAPHPSTDSSSVPPARREPSPSSQERRASTNAGPNASQGHTQTQDWPHAPHAHKTSSSLWKVNFV